MTGFRSIWSRIDGFLAAILLTVAFASLLPARGHAAVAVSWLTDGAIALLFFMHGARLSPQVALLGARHWRLHTLVFLSTFVLFPLLGVSAHFLAPGLLSAPLWAGVILLTALPSTVQASIAFTSVAGGNVPAALCSASASNLLGVFLTPLIAGFCSPATAPTSLRARFLPSSRSSWCRSWPVSCRGHGSALTSRAMRARSKPWIMGRSCSSSIRLSAKAW